MISLVSVFSPSSPSSMFNLLNCIILKTVALFWEITHYFLWQKLQRISHFKFEFFLPSCASFLLPKNIKVDPIIRIILVPPLSSVKLSRTVVRENGGGASVRNPSPLSPKMKWHFLQGSMESRQFESRSAAPPPPAPPHFEKADYTPANETAQNTRGVLNFWLGTDVRPEVSTTTL